MYRWYRRMISPLYDAVTQKVANGEGGFGASGGPSDVALGRDPSRVVGHVCVANLEVLDTRK